METVRISILCALCGILSSCGDTPGQKRGASLSYHFDAPAAVWEETFPLGNGRIGLMPDGGLDTENYVLNEISMWSGSKQDTENPDAQKHLGEIRRLLFEGRNDEAQALMYKTFVCKGEGSGEGSGYAKPYGSYQLFGNLVIDYAQGGDSVTGYRRELRFDDATATVSYSKGGITYRREAFTSFASDLGVIRLTADKAEALNFTVSMNRKSNVGMEPGHDAKCSVSGNDLSFSGRLLAGTEDGVSTEAQGMRYGARVRVLLPKGGQIKAGADNLAVEGADEAVILVGMATGFFGKNVDEQLDALISSAEGKPYGTMKKEHTEAFRKLFSRVEVDFGHNAGREQMPMDKRLEAFAQDKDDPSLAALYYQFGRYLLISSTRPGLLPPNLQGLWANTVKTPWNGDYHLNINLQMNLWPAESGNLSELQMPLVEWTKQQVESGRKTAEAFYGARGWVTHILGNVWEFTAPGEHPSWGATNTSAAWLCEHLYKHYQFTCDKEYLKDVYPTMKEAALFFVDMLVEDPRNGYLVTAPTTSPENSYMLPNGKTANVCAGSTMDNQILRELFTNTIEAAEILGVDTGFADTLAERRSRLMPTAIGADGRIMEWLEPYAEAEPHHRHVSHLYGLHPSNEISIVNTPELAAAARKTLEARGDESTGWSMAWKINFWARLHDGEHAFKLLADLLRPCGGNSVNYSKGGGTYPNLFCAHPPFQIDGNFGGCAGIAEMLVQSHAGCIELLPALPAAWRTGRFSGLCVQGGGEVSASWDDGSLASAALTAKADGVFKIKLPAKSTARSASLNGRTVEVGDDGFVSVEMEAGETLTIDN